MHGTAAIVALCAFLTLLWGCESPVPPVQRPIELPVICWYSSVAALPSDNPEVCRIKFEITRRDIYSDTVHVRTQPLTLETLWGEPAQLAMFNPELSGMVDSSYRLERSLPGYDPKETDGFFCYALPRRHADGRCDLQSRIRIKQRGQTVFETEQTISLNPGEL